MIETAKWRTAQRPGNCPSPLNRGQLLGFAWAYCSPRLPMYFDQLPGCLCRSCLKGLINVVRILAPSGSGFGAEGSSLDQLTGDRPRMQAIPQAMRMSASIRCPRLGWVPDGVMHSLTPTSTEAMYRALVAMSLVRRQSYGPMSYPPPNTRWKLKEAPLSRIVA